MSVTFTTRPIILACLFSARKKKREREREKSSEEKDRPFEFQERDVRFLTRASLYFALEIHGHLGRTGIKDDTRPITWPRRSPVGRERLGNRADPWDEGVGKKERRRGETGLIVEGIRRRIREYCEIPCMQKRDKWHGLLRERLIEWGSMLCTLVDVFKFFPPSTRKITRENWPLVPLLRH